MLYFLALKPRTNFQRTESPKQFAPVLIRIVRMRFVAVAVLVMCTAFHLICAMDETVKGENQKSNRVFTDGAATVDKQSLLHRERRAVKNNSSPNPAVVGHYLPDIEKRLQTMEEM